MSNAFVHWLPYLPNRTMKVTNIDVIALRKASRNSQFYHLVDTIIRFILQTGRKLDGLFFEEGEHKRRWSPSGI